MAVSTLNFLSVLAVDIVHLNEEMQLVHMASRAQSKVDAQNGLIFMQELLELMKNAHPAETFPDHSLPLTVIPLIAMPAHRKRIRFTVASAQFGPQLHHTTGVQSSFFRTSLSLIRFRYLLSPNLFDRLQLVRLLFILVIFILVLALSIVVNVCSLKKLVS